MLFYKCSGDNLHMEYNAKQLEIINIAEKLFAKQGFAGTSVRDISQEAEMNVSMISYYFGSKDKLIEAVRRIKEALAKLS